MSTRAEYISTDQDWQNETTRYWFKVDIENEREQSGEYCIADCGGTRTVLDLHGYPVDYSDEIRDTVMRVCGPIVDSVQD